MLPKVALQFNLTNGEAVPPVAGSSLAPSNLGVSGQHFFTTTTTPFFDLDVDADLQLGQASCGKNNTVPAPTTAPRGQGNETAVAWLKLLAKNGTTGHIQEVYRVETAGGNPPSTCAGMPASFQVQYSAQYVLPSWL
jgi:hypothetical protein